MIRLLKQIVNWLDARFPETRTVTVADYEGLQQKLFALEGEISIIRQLSNESRNGIEVAVSRIGTLETHSVHKDAVKDLVLVVKAVKEDFTSLKASLGMNRIANADIQALLNGEPISNE